MAALDPSDVAVKAAFEAVSTAASKNAKQKTVLQKLAQAGGWRKHGDAVGCTYGSFCARHPHIEVRDGVLHFDAAKEGDAPPAAAAGDAPQGAEPAAAAPQSPAVVGAQTRGAASRKRLQELRGGALRSLCEERGGGVEVEDWGKEQCIEWLMRREEAAATPAQPAAAPAPKTPAAKRRRAPAPEVDDDDKTEPPAPEVDDDDITEPPAPEVDDDDKADDDVDNDDGDDDDDEDDEEVPKTQPEEEERESGEEEEEEISFTVVGDAGAKLREGADLKSRDLGVVVPKGEAVVRKAEALVDGRQRVEVQWGEARGWTSMVSGTGIPILGPPVTKSPVKAAKKQPKAAQLKQPAAEPPRKKRKYEKAGQKASGSTGEPAWVAVAREQAQDWMSPAALEADAAGASPAAALRAKEAEMLAQLRKEVFQENKSRRNVKLQADSVLAGFCLGAIKTYSKGICMSMNTKLRPELTKLIVEFAKMSRPGFRFTSIQVNKNYASALHVDSGNLGPSYIYGTGDYTEGDLYVHGAGTIPVKGEWYKFNGNVPHCTCPFKGERYTLIYFTNQSYNLCKPKDIEDMKAMGIPFPELGQKKGDYGAKAPRLEFAKVRMPDNLKQFAGDKDKGAPVNVYKPGARKANEEKKKKEKAERERAKAQAEGKGDDEEGKGEGKRQPAPAAKARAVQAP